MIKYFLFLVLLTSLAFAGPGPASNIVQFSKTGVPTNVDNGSNPLPVTLSGGGGTIGTVDQGAPGSMATPWWVEGTDGTNHASYTVGNSENVNLTGSSGSISVTQGTSPWVVSGTVTSNIGTTGGLALDATLSALSAKFGSLGQKTMAGSAPVVIASDQSAIPVSISAPSAPINPAGSFTQNTSIGSSGAATLTKPANAVGFILYASSSNAQNLRYAVGATASTTSGMRLEPGRDTGYVPLAANISVEAEAGSSQEVDVQWVLNQ